MTPPPPVTPLERFRLSTPKPLLIGFLRAAIEGCRAARVAAGHYGEERAVDAIPALRRLEVEMRLAALTRPPGFKVLIRRNPSTTYTEFSASGVVLTGTTRTHEVSWVAPARYRKLLAETAQQALWVQPKSVDTVYGLLVYGGAWNATIPSVSIAFPTISGHLLSAQIDLVAEYPEVVAEYLPVEEAEVVVQPAVALKKKKAE